MPGLSHPPAARLAGQQHWYRRLVAHMLTTTSRSHADHSHPPPPTPYPAPPPSGCGRAQLSNIADSCFIAEDATVDALQVVIDIPNDLITQWNDYVRLIKDALAHASGSLPRDVYIGPQFLEDPKLPASTAEFISRRRRDMLQAKHTTSYYVGIAYPRTAAGAARREAFDQVVTSNLFQRISLVPLHQAAQRGQQL